jgi:hypothetical protein
MRATGISSAESETGGNQSTPGRPGSGISSAPSPILARTVSTQPIGATSTSSASSARHRTQHLAPPGESMPQARRAARACAACSALPPLHGKALRRVQKRGDFAAACSAVLCMYSAVAPGAALTWDRHTLPKLEMIEGDLEIAKETMCDLGCRPAARCPCGGLLWRRVRSTSISPDLQCSSLTVVRNPRPASRPLGLAGCGAAGGS